MFMFWLDRLVTKIGRTSCGLEFPTVNLSDGASTSFVPKIDPNTGRIDLVITRPGDKTGVSGNGLLASIVFEAIGAGNSQIALSGLAMNTAGQAVLVAFSPATVTVR